MSLSEVELVEHCKHILESSRIKNRLVVLCEGYVKKNFEPLSPQVYKRMEQMPDANFYKNCISRSWREKIPHFFNCGDRKNVIEAHSRLISLHKENPDKSYLNPEKLFAIVDLDIQSCLLSSECVCEDTETLYKDIYRNGRLEVSKLSSHQIWVTGLIHKEAYFLMPSLQFIFDSFSTKLVYSGEELKLEKVYLDMVNDLSDDEDLKNNFQRVLHRVEHCLGPELEGFEGFCSQFKESSLDSNLQTEYQDYVKALLSIKKAKQYWKSICLESFLGNKNALEDQILLKIGRYFSEDTTNASDFHLPGFFRFLFNFR
jgi:hypothetical protein